MSISWVPASHVPFAPLPPSFAVAPGIVILATISFTVVLRCSSSAGVGK